MKKKRLREISIPKANFKQIRAVALNCKEVHGVIMAQKKKVDEQETLVLNVYQVGGKNKKDISLMFRVFCQKDDYTTLEIDNDKWRTGALLYLVCRDSGWCECWWNYSQLEFLSTKDADLVKKTLNKWLGNNDVFATRSAFEIFDKYQNYVKKVRLMKKHRKETDVIDAEMEKFEGLPEDYQQFVEERVFKDDNYIFYNTKKKRAYCTSCKCTFQLENKHLRHTIGIWNEQDEVKHNNTVRCPYCNKFLQAKSEGVSRQSLVSVQWSVLVQSHGEELLTRYFCHTKDFRMDFYNPKITTNEGYRTVHTAEKVTYYMWAHYKSTANMRWCYYRDRSSMWYPLAETVSPRTTVLYNTNLSEMVAGTCMKYSVPDIFMIKVANDQRQFNSPWLIDNYFNSYRKYPFIEQLLKVGFYRMVKEFLEGSGIRNTELNKDCKSILGTLGINKYQYNMLRKLENPRLRDLEILRYKPDLKWNEFLTLRHISENGYVDIYKKYIDFMKYTTLYKLCKYIGTQNISHPQDYFDYASWLEKMDYDMRNEFNLFPRIPPSYVSGFKSGSLP